MDLLELLKAALYGIVEGITEWLPVSSTGHMLLLDQFVKLDVSRDFWDMFLVVIQLGAILAVCVLFFDKLNPFSRKKDADGRKKTWSLWAKVVAACFAADSRFRCVEPMARGPDEWTEFETLFRGQGLPIHAAAWEALVDPNEQSRAPLTIAPEDEPREGVARRESHGKEWRLAHAEGD